MIPLMIDFSGRIVTIVGGGTVGARKASYFHQDAEVRVVSRSFSEDLAGLSVERVCCDLDGISDAGIDGLVAGSFLVIAATSDWKLNRRIAGRCRELGILCNLATGEGGDVLLPSVVRGERYSVAISTAGQSPGVPRYVRGVLERELGGLDAMIAIQQELRTLLREKVTGQEERQRLLRAVLEDPEVWAMAVTDPEGARELAKRRYGR
ncbi:MAG: bifunctional precorrin-2 dehydrogenase/sirohydrochlorin ferrochelatase [Methanomicrobiaceae archaeon]|nr:bifunctional precorrin-2 dehydrogenase/sirohydrochlorin ferrochelatase [Methanomicrobiaceae archaeon]